MKIHIDGTVGIAAYNSDKKLLEALNKHRQGKNAKHNKIYFLTGLASTECGYNAHEMYIYHTPDNVLSEQLSMLSAIKLLRMLFTSNNINTNNIDIYYDCNVLQSYSMIFNSMQNDTYVKFIELIKKHTKEGKFSTNKIIKELIIAELILLHTTYSKSKYKPNINVIHGDPYVAHAMLSPFRFNVTNNDKPKIINFKNPQMAF